MTDASFVALMGIAAACVLLLYVIVRRRFAARCPYCFAYDPIRHDPPSRRLEDYRYECRACRRSFDVRAAAQ